MNKKNKVLLGLAAASVMAANVANAESTVQQILDGITVGGPSSVTVGIDEVNPDAYWNIGGSGASIATIVIEIAGDAEINTFGIFDKVSGNTVQVFSGSDSMGDQAIVSIMADGKVKLNFADTGVVFSGYDFGYYLGTKNGNFYSDTTKNGDQYDHMWAYRGEGDTVQIGSFSPGPWGSNEYILAWEDTFGGGDNDHNDFLVMVESVTPVPTPDAGTTLMLLGMGMLGLGSIRRKLA